MARNETEPAFPNEISEEFKGQKIGLTKREYFTAMIAAGVEARGEDATALEVAERAIRIADALLDIL